jgi:hypothetical protein
VYAAPVPSGWATAFLAGFPHQTHLPDSIERTVDRVAGVRIKALLPRSQQGWAPAQDDMPLSRRAFPPESPFHRPSPRGSPDRS